MAAPKAPVIGGSNGTDVSLDEVAMRRRAGLLQVPDLGLRQLALGDSVERELHGVVPVDVRGLHLDDGARAGLDHGDGRHRPRVGVEDLAHAELLAQDSLQSSMPFMRSRA